ncbi:uncharacterized protein L969DRAFT_51149 [Mixia osmundae IAM 14324]|uniref:AA1-like domain-containing protein n=1 Tax=Mixia osmundae (strain CBS 9802 / IAM 14324 / JCM 22182 / KY 12970) TaxID=764103 RepID=G7E0J0_MIXOS|nr:uncharacterized protein L969DRAFT_51149 [Mixia osmundae IAM 14324]KEI38361.1 hypothetical protein L969DRAFT_51149 [Mixia osmundae IAM 14324]GAA96350.1 hypothetical protein E5Q_03016 [Mixia osmundae IAM 14324]
MFANILLATLTLCIAIAASPIVNTTALSLDERGAPLGYIFDLHWTSAGVCTIPATRFNIRRLGIRTWTLTTVSFKVPVDKSQTPTCVQGPCKDIAFLSGEDAAHMQPINPKFYALTLMDYTAGFTGGKFPGCCTIDYDINFFLNPYSGQGSVDPDFNGSFAGLCYASGRSKVNGAACDDVLGHPAQLYTYFKSCYQTGLRPTISSTPYYA